MVVLVAEVLLNTGIRVCYRHRMRTGPGHHTKAVSAIKLEATETRTCTFFLLRRHVLHASVEREELASGIGNLWRTANLEKPFSLLVPNQPGSDACFPAAGSLHIWGLVLPTVEGMNAGVWARKMVVPVMYSELPVTYITTV